MPKGTKVAKAERALRASARAKGLTGARANRYIYGTLTRSASKKAKDDAARAQPR
jgi:hypothetical protein